MMGLPILGKVYPEALKEYPHPEVWEVPALINDEKEKFCSGNSFQSSQIDPGYFEGHFHNF